MFGLFCLSQHSPDTCIIFFNFFNFCVQFLVLSAIISTTSLLRSDVVGVGGPQQGGTAVLNIRRVHPPQRRGAGQVVLTSEIGTSIGIGRRADEYIYTYYIYIPIQ